MTTSPSPAGADATAFLRRVIEAQQRGEAAGVYSICSANRTVLEAGMAQALADGTNVLVESTANQVNQFGGYSGMTAADFARFVREVAAGTGFPPGRVVLGGDHLGPLVWTGEGAPGAMDKARTLIRDSVLAGYAKIHLDASMSCADDPGGEAAALDPETITARAADLAAVAEAAHAERPGTPPPLYVVGTDVPIPGGETQDAHGAPLATRTEDLARTIALARAAFEARGLDRAWERVIAVVVQPGVEFGDSVVFEYRREKATALAREIEKHPGLVFEAHSTDYQTPARLHELVQDHFAVLKVGPALTFAFREAVFALEEIEKEWLGRRAGVVLSRVSESLDAAMSKNPAHWRKHYRGDDEEIRLARRFSLSDRSRYYWAEAPVREALARLIANLAQRPPPLSLLSQYLPVQYDAVRSGRIAAAPGDLLRHRVSQVTDAYAAACGMR